MMIIRDREYWEKLKHRAHEGDLKAEWEMGASYADGIIDENGNILVDINPQLSVFWYKKSALHGNSSAQLNLGYCYATGFGVEKDPSKALYWYKKAYKNKDQSPVAATSIAFVYRDEGNYRRALIWFKKATKLDEDAFFDVGYHYLKGLGVKCNYSLAMKNFKKAIKAEYITEITREKAMFFIGLMYYEGHGVKKSMSKAKKWFEMANQDNDNEDAIQMLLKMEKESDPGSVYTANRQ